MRTTLAVIFLAALSGGAYYGYQHWPREEGGPAYVTGLVQRGNLVATVMATGTVEPLVKVVVGSQVSGTVMRWYSDFNDEVKENDLLAELDQDRLKAAVAQRQAALNVALARVEEAEARVAEARLQRTRIENAMKRNASSQFEVESARIAEQAAIASQHAAEAQVEAERAQLRAAQIELSKTRIHSPIDGVVISRDVDAGQTVAASLSAPTLFTIANDLARMRINAAVSETDIGRIREGMPAEFRVDAYPNRKFRGVVTQVRFAETVVDNIVTYQTLIEVENPELLLRPGMTASIRFEVAKADSALNVANSALRFDPEKQPKRVINWRPARGAGKKQPRVFKVVNDQLVEVMVTLGLTDGSRTAIESAELREGDRIATDWDYTQLRAQSTRRRMF